MNDFKDSNQDFSVHVMSGCCAWGSIGKNKSEVAKLNWLLGFVL